MSDQQSDPPVAVQIHPRLAGQLMEAAGFEQSADRWNDPAGHEPRTTEEALPAALQIVADALS